MEKKYKCPLCNDFETDEEEYFEYHLTQSLEDGGCVYICPCDKCSK